MDSHVDPARLHALLDRARRDLDRTEVENDTQLAARAAVGGDDIAQLQTAAALENLAVSLYTAALTLPALRGGDGTVTAFVTATRNQHADHAAAFNTAVTQAGGGVQTNPDPTYDRIVQNAPFATMDDVVVLAARLENVMTQTYVRSTADAGIPALRALFASVAAVEAQHQAVLLAAGAVLQAAPTTSLSLQPAVARLPAAVGWAGFPVAVTPVTNAAPPAEGAL